MANHSTQISDAVMYGPQGRVSFYVPLDDDAESNRLSVIWRELEPFMRPTSCRVGRSDCGNYRKIEWLWLPRNRSGKRIR